MDVKQAIQISEKQVERERKRPERLPLEEFAYMNRFTQ
jgi:hypothetical protein